MPTPECKRAGLRPELARAVHLVYTCCSNAGGGRSVVTKAGEEPGEINGMKALKKSNVETIITHAEAGELDKLTGEMVHLPQDALAELKALVWLGKDQDTPKHWDALVIEARFQLDDQTARFIASTPDLPGVLRHGLEKLESSGRI